MTFDRRELSKNLRTMLAVYTDRPIGRQKAPKFENPANPAFPYSIVYAIGGGEYSGPAFSDPDADVVCVYQVSSFGARDDQAELQATKIRKAVLSRTNGAFTTELLDPEGMKIIDRRPQGGPGGVDENDGIYFVAERFELVLTPG